MDKTFKQILVIIKNTIKAVLLPLLPFILLILLIVILFASFVYFITVDDGTYKESDWSNVPYATSTAMNNITVNSDGTISSSMTAEELWDTLIKNGSDVDKYLDSPEELKKLMNAQIVTQYPDIRPDTSVPIDWSKVDVNNPPGIVKFIRSDTSNNKQNMQYVEPDKFQSYIDEYNKTGNQQAKENALKSFTIETKSSANNSSTYKVDSLNNFLFIGDSFTVGLEDANIISNVTFKAVRGKSPNYWLEHFSELPTENIKGVCVLLGVNGLGSDSGVDSTASDMKKLIDKLCTTYNGTPVYIQKVFPLAKKHNDEYTVKNENVEKYNSQIKEYCNSKQGVYFIDTTNGYVDSDGFLIQNKTSDGLHLNDCTDWAKNIENAIVSSNNSNSSSSSNIQSQTDELFWPTDLTHVTSYYGDREGGFHNGIDIETKNGSDTVGNPVYACEEGTVKCSQRSDSAGEWIVIDHGNGYTSEYMHNSSRKVSAGEKVKKGQLIAISGDTGDSNGVHLHFEINKDEQSIDPLSFKYSNGQGSGTGGFGNYSTAQTGDKSSNTEILVKVATWTETTHIEENTDPELQDKNSSETTYSMTTESIPYQNLVSGYTMPFEFLWAILVIGEDKDFVLALADLVYGSDIEITIHDSLTIDTKEKVYTYNKKVYAESKGSVLAEVEIENPNGTFHLEEKGSWINDISDKSYTTKTTDIRKENTLEIALTRANVWMADYKKEYDWQNIPPDVQTEDPKMLKNIVEDEPFETNNDDKFGHIEELKTVAKKRIEEYDVIKYKFLEDHFEAKYYKRIHNRKERITNTTEGNKYIASPETITEKTDKEGKNGPNFVTLFNDQNYAKNKSNILSVPDWLFEILEANDSTKEMVDLMKYLLYKATETNYGVTEYDFEIFDPNNFSDVTGIYGGTIQEKVWFALRDLGYSEIAVAGAMGNISGENSTWDTGSIEAGYGIGAGLCQWSHGRRTQLEEYAKSKGVSWTDPDTQVEFLVTEISGKGNAVGYANKRTAGAVTEDMIVSTNEEWANAKNTDDATLYFMRFFESPAKYGEPDEWSSLANRQKEAAKFLKEFSGKKKPEGGTVQTTEGDGYNQIYISSKGRSYKEYKQFLGSYKDMIYHPYGETISASGCSITSIAVILSGYGVNVDPGDLSNHNYLQEHISSHGVSYERAPKDKSKLMTGRPALVGISGELKIEGKSKYYGGHFIAILDARGTNEVYVSDVGSMTSGWAKVEDILSIASDTLTYITQD